MFGCGRGALTAISAGKAGVPINAMAAISVASFFMTAPETCRISPSNNNYRQKMAVRGCANVFRRFPACVAPWPRTETSECPLKAKTGPCRQLYAMSALPRESGHRLSPSPCPLSAISRHRVPSGFRSLFRFYNANGFSILRNVAHGRM
jgi:hypothetical protein